MDHNVTHQIDQSDEVRVTEIRPYNHLINDEADCNLFNKVTTATNHGCTLQVKTYLLFAPFVVVLLFFLLIYLKH